jgi:tRNA threonylcarbamoyladenosine biosynthesis protein TsaB
MKILAIESSAKAASVALSDGGRLAAQYFLSAGLTHSATLMKMAEDLLATLGLEPRGLDCVAVVHGPGSFTGIRIGVSAAIGLAWGADLPACGVSTLEAMAHQLPEPDAVICPVMDARRNEVYTASFRYEDGRIKRLGEDRAIPVTDLASEAAASNQPYILLGDGAELAREAFASSAPSSGSRRLCCGFRPPGAWPAPPGMPRGSRPTGSNRTICACRRPNANAARGCAPSAGTAGQPSDENKITRPFAGETDVKNSRRRNGTSLWLFTYWTTPSCSTSCRSSGIKTPASRNSAS